MRLKEFQSPRKYWDINYYWEKANIQIEKDIKERAEFIRNGGKYEDSPLAKWVEAYIAKK
jgi:hypothetical protein